MPGVSPSQFLGPKEVATRLGITTRTLRHWCKDKNHGPRFLQLGRKILYDPADIDLWIELRFSRPPDARA